MPAERKLRAAYAFVRTTNLADQEALERAIEAKPQVQRYGHEYVFGNVHKEDNGLITGRMGFPAIEELVERDYDEVLGEFNERVVEHPDAPSVPFVLDPADGLIAFEDLSPRIKPRGFVGHFRALLEKGVAEHNIEFAVELAFRSENVREFLSRVSRVTSVRFEVRPTNPDDRESFRPLDEALKRARAKRARVVMENDEEGLELEPSDPDKQTDNLLEQGVLMVESGYGTGREFQIEAEDEHEPVIYDARAGGSLIRDLAPNVPDDHGSRIAILKAWLGERLDELRGLRG